MEIKQFAPVLIPTLNRHVHFKRCVESLARCTHAEKTDLYISLDFPSNESHKQGYRIIKDYLITITMFKSVTIIEREKNYGAIDNFFNSAEQLFTKHERIIISEDDNVFSPNFLDYTNKGLEIYKDNLKIRAICGYKFPFDLPSTFQENHFFFKSFSAWGFGIWRDRFLTKNECNEMIPKINTYLKNPIKSSQLNKYQYGLLMGLMNIVKTNKITGDRIYCYNNIVNDTYCVFPSISKVRNTGHDGTGEHCPKLDNFNNIFCLQEIDNNNFFTYTSSPNYKTNTIEKIFAKHYKKDLKMTFYKQIKLYVKYLLFIITY